LAYTSINLPYLHEESTSSDSTLNICLTWLKFCLQNHTRCHRHRLKSEFVPTRLIDVGEQAEDEWRLCLSASGKPVVYTTLSHRWGGTKPLQLLSTNLQEFLEGFPVNRLPRTFQDALTITRRLGARFIWIDSLCIIQDSKMDWQIEASKMKDIYLHSICNIAAAASLDPSGGCFKQRDKFLMFGPEVSFDAAQPSCPDSRVGETCVTYHPDQLDYSIDGVELNRRGWVLQERTVAARILHFAKQQVIWECDESLLSESFPSPEAEIISFPGILSHSSRPPLMKFITGIDGPDYVESFDSLGRRENGCTTWDFWDSLVEDYSGRQLTKPTDKLIAISGIANIIQQWTGMTYLAGLWQSDLHQQLLWRRRKSKQATDATIELPSGQSQIYRAPSWSWASIDRPVERAIPKFWDTRIQLIELLEHECVPTAEDPTGQIDNAFLKVRGHLLHARFSELQNEDSNIKIDKVGHVNAVFDVDTVELSEELWYLPILSYRNFVCDIPMGPSSNALVIGLIISIRNGQYSRRGLAEKNYFGGMAEIDEVFGLDRVQVGSTVELSARFFPHILTII
jgi:hypothetical protein